MKLTDEERERIAIQVEHLPEDEAQAAYDRRCELMERMKEQGRKKDVQQSDNFTGHSGR
jgi:hypothetical protein